MDAHEDTPRIQILSVSDTGRRRRWTDDEKVRIVEEGHRDGVTLAKVARRHEISRAMLYDWRYRHKLGLLGVPAPFMRLMPMDIGTGPAVVAPPSAQPLAAMFAHSIEVGHVFHAIVGTHSTASWAAIPREGGQV